MIGTAAIPITALSAKLISMNRNNKPTRSHACFGAAAWGVVVAPRNRTAVSRIAGLADREAWTLIGNSVQVRGTHSYPYYGTNRSVIPDRPSADHLTQERILRAAFEAFTEDGYADTSTLEIARRAKISKRDLYANFSSKQ